MTSSVVRIALIATAVSLAACTAESVSEPATPEVQRLQLGQLSAGGGIAGYDFYATVNGAPKRIGALLVIEDASNPSAGYNDETEYWRFDPLALAELETGSIGVVSVDFIGKRKQYRQWLVDQFENGTETWTAWNVNRLFELGTDPVVVWNQPANGQVLYTMEGKRWRKADGGYITYYLELDFTIGEAWPEMTWYIDYDDFSIWQENRGDDNRIYEVRLRDDTDLNQTAVGVGYELKTIK